VDTERTISDVDLVLCPAPGTRPNDHAIELALLHCRQYGLYGSDAACVIDPCYRQAGPTVARTPLFPHTRIRTIKLFSPRLENLINRGRIREFRCVGEVGIEFVRRANETGYYAKLPRENFDGQVLPYLRPAIEITASENEPLRQNSSGSVGDIGT
jgi:hypothetical protein